MGVDWIHLGMVLDFSKHGHEPSGSIKGRYFLDQLSNY
jgi:hypothetical protein